jgi:glycosyltransferase involved in cell wall biosynthesis
LKIAHVTATFPPYLAGTGNVAFHNARSLSRRGHDVTVYTATLPGTRDREDGAFRIRRLWAPIRLGNAPLLPGLVRVNGYDLIHLHCPFIFGAELIWLLGLVRRQPYVVTYHNDLVGSRRKGMLFRSYDFIWAKRVLTSARVVIVPSLDGALSSPVVAPLHRNGAARLKEVPNGVDTNVFRPAADRGGLRRRLGIRNVGDQLLLFAGAMDRAHESKGGIPKLLDAVVRLKAPHVSLLLAGGGDLLAHYHRLADRLGLERRTQFFGSVPHEQMAYFYAAADVVVQPSVSYEPFGLAALEAMACATPVVATDLPGARRIVADAGGGLLARRGDSADLAAKIDLLLADPGLRERLGTAGRAGVVAHYDWDRIAAMLEDTYLQALAQR